MRAPKGWRKFVAIGPLQVYQNTTNGRLGTYQPNDPFRKIKEWDSFEQIEAWLKEHADDLGGIDVLIFRKFDTYSSPRPASRATIFHLPTGDYAYENGNIIDMWQFYIMPYSAELEALINGHIESWALIKQAMDSKEREINDLAQSMQQKFHLAQVHEKNKKGIRHD